MSTRLIIVGLIASLSLVNGAGQETSKALRVVGYYADWTAARYPLAEIPADKLTHVNYAFGKIGPDNRLTWNASAAVEHVYPGDCAEAGCPHGLFNQIRLLKQKHPHLKFLMSVGGWTDSAPFYEMAASEATRQTFARVVRRFPEDLSAVRRDRHRLGASGFRRPAARKSARMRGTTSCLLDALRKSIGPGKLLTVAASASPRGIDPLEYADMAGILDWVNVMTYDFHSGGTRAGFNSALYNHDDPSNPTPEPARRRAGDRREGRSADQARRRRAVLRARLARRRIIAGVEHGDRLAAGRRLPGNRRHLPESRRDTSGIGTTSRRCRGCTTRTRRNGSRTRTRSRCG